MTGSGQPLAARETQVTIQMNRLGEGLGELEAIAEELTQRLATVCAPPNQVPKELDKPHPDQLVPLANDLKRCDNRLRVIINGLRTLSGSIEL